MWKKVLFFIILLLICVRIAFIIIDEKVDKGYYVSTIIDTSTAKEIPCINISQRFVSEQQKRLNSLELILSNIADDKLGSICLKILKDDKDYFYPESYFFNSELHLNNEGKRIRTQQLIDDLERYLSDEVLTVGQSWL